CLFSLSILSSQLNLTLFPFTTLFRSKFVGIILLDDIRPVMFNQKLYDEIKVRELMQAAPEIIDLGKDSTRDIMRKFQDSDAWNLPVIENDMYVGFISKSKLLTAYRQKLIEVTV